MEPYGVIYVATCSVNGKQYVGLTTARDPNQYWKGHLKGGRSARSKKPFHQAIRKYGPDSFSFEVIWTAFDKISLDDAEDYFIVYELKTLAPSGYNIKRGGARGKMTAAGRLAIKTALSDPNVKERQIAGINAAYLRPGHRDRQRIATIIALNKPETKVKNKARGALNREPNRRAKNSAGVKLAFSRSGMHDKLSLCTIGTRWITDGETNKRTRASILPDGWYYGRTISDEVELIRRQKISLVQTGRRGKKGHLSDRRWITNGFANRRIVPVDSLPDGWRFGKSPR